MNQTLLLRLRLAPVIMGVLEDLTAEHHAPLLAAIWRELGTLDVSKARITGVFGVEDFEHERNRVGMLEVSCIARGRPVELTGAQMVPLAHGYHLRGANSVEGGGSRPKYYIGSGGAPKAGMMPDLSLIRLPPAHKLDARLLGLLLRHPTVVGGILGSTALLVAASTLSGSVQQWTVTLIYVLTGGSHRACILLICMHSAHSWIRALCVWCRC